MPNSHRRVFCPSMLLKQFVRKIVPYAKTAKKAPPSKKQEKTKADYEAFLSAAGGWKDVDTDKLIADIYATRRRSNRPVVKL